MVQLSLVAIKSLIANAGYPEIQAVNSKTYYVLVKGNDKDLLKARNAIFPALIKNAGGKLGETRKPGDPHKLENEYVELGNIRFYIRHAKTKKTPKHLTFGRENEQNFYQIVNEHLKVYETINIEFQVKGRTQFVANNVVKIVKTGKKVANRSKSDVELITDKGKKIPISLKQVNAPYWESPETYWGENAKRILEYALAHRETELEPDGNVFRLSKAIAIKATPQETKDLVFGNDIFRNGAVVKQTWNQGHVLWNDTWRVLCLECEDVIVDMADISPDDEPYFQIRNHREKTSKHLYPGLFLVATRKELTRNDAVLPDSARRFVA